METDNTKEVEELFLSSCMNCDDFQDRIENAHLAKEYFLDITHKNIYDKMITLSNSNIKYDFSVLFNNVKDFIKASDLTAIYAKLSTSANIKYHFDNLKKSKIKHDLKLLLNESARAIKDNEDVYKIIDKMASMANDIQENNDPEKIYTIEETIPEAMGSINKTLVGDDNIIGIKSGIHTLDKVLGGFEGGELIILAARPSKGKSTLMINIASYASVKHNCHIDSLEMKAAKLTRKIIQATSEVDLKNDDPNDVMQKISRHIVSVQGLKLTINQKRLRTVYSVDREARKLHRQGKLDMLLIDYVGLMELLKDKRNEGIGEVTRVLKCLAGDIDIPVILLAQLNREYEGTNKKPILKHLKESGDIEQDADKIVFIHDENPDDTENENYQLVVAKNREGELADIRVKFKKKYQKFIEEWYS